MADLDKVVVTDFAEVWPWGNPCTRWKLETYGKIWLQGCVEMAWVMGPIKHFTGATKGNQYAAGAKVRVSKYLYIEFLAFAFSFSLPSYFLF